MAQGWDRVEQEAAAQAERAARSGTPQLFMKDGDAVNVRFLEQGQEIFNFKVHEYRTKEGWYRFFTCLNDDGSGTPCPGCQAGLKDKLKGAFNIIQRQRPILRKGADGKAMKGPDQQYIVEGYQDEVVVWVCPSTTLDLLRKKDGHYKGLMSRDFEISKSGTQFSPFVIEPTDPDSGPVPMTPEDQVLLAKKHDINKFMAPPSFTEAAKIVAENKQRQGGVDQQPQPSQGPAGGGGAQDAQAAGGVANPFVGTRPQA